MIKIKLCASKFFSFLKMDEVEEMKEFLTGLDLTQATLDSLFRQLDKSGKKALANWKEIDKSDWKDIAGGILAGVQIHNYLHPKCIFY
jgi:hypothetical protein